ncbi:MAG: hypothetical protein ACJ8LG_02255 [Massilia sp.]
MIKSALRLATGSVLLLASICATASAATADQAFQLKGSLQEIPGPSPRCASNFGGTILGAGDSALLGKVVFIATDCITPNGSLYTFSDGRFIITTATGEQVYANYSGQFVPTGEGTKYVFSNATFQITGGTGRYARASGGGDLTGGEDMATGQGNVALTGRILLKEK